MLKIVFETCTSSIIICQLMVHWLVIVQIKCHPLYSNEGKLCNQRRRKEGRKEGKLKEVHKGRLFYNYYVTPLITLIAFEACVKMCFSSFALEILNVWSQNLFYCCTVHY